MSAAHLVAAIRLRRMRRRTMVVGGALALLLAGLALTLTMGQSFVPPGTVLRVLAGQDVPGASFTVGQLRLPRAVLSVLAGVLFGLDKGYRPFVYQQLLLPMFAAAVVGGLGSPAGAIAGSMIVAFSELTLTFAWKKALAYVLPAAWASEGMVQALSTEYKFAVSFLILIVVLLFRPTGLFRGKSV